MKIGRNDPCPCGSGRKYKNCCLEGQGPGLSPEGPAGVFAEIRQALQGRQFSSLEEVQSFTDRFMRQRNQAPMADFHGLSPDQMHRILHFPFDSPNLVTYATVVAGEPRAPILTLFHLLAEAIGEQGLKPTATGNLPRNVCREAASVYWGDETIRKDGRFVHINKEEDFSPLHVTRLVAGLSGLIRKSRGRFILSRECRTLLADHGLAGVYPRLFHSYVRDFNWAYRDGFPDLGFIQRSFLFSLYLLDLHGGEWLPGVFYEDAFLGAFPRVLGEVTPTPYSTPEKTVRSCYNWRVLVNFAAFLGLAEVEPTTKERYDGFSRVRKRPLLADAVRFHIPR
ncbi:MAG: hypothetical protein A2Z40_00155 [Deltaproteobacteria bacterium RBG_19FT_COMBO_60_16]|nr:MAG: hypothetical protein A2Z13_08315 [Deltaproteobacteria bacterium RBG_16_64_85]OGQ00870.1 MAG: hypothetical protein A2Z40_00155 [Deltaproteobacteria bacterium RBG_19FT_COMBO_60_16]